MILQILEKLGVPIYNSYGQFRFLINIIEDLQQAVIQLNMFYNNTEELFNES